MEPLLHNTELVLGASGVLVTALIGCAWRTRQVRRQRLEKDLLWRELVDRVDRERRGLA